MQLRKAKAFESRCWSADLTRPWSLAFVGNGAMLVSERVGRLRVIRNGELDPQPVEGLPEVRAENLSGLMDIALHPNFASNGYVYLSYNKPLAADDAALAIARGRWDGRALRDTRDIFVAGTETGGVSRLAFGADRMLYMSTGGGGQQQPQDPNAHGGKVLRLTDEGKVPPDNPFVGRSGYKPEIFTLGHRNTLGLAAHPTTGKIWQLEMGPNGGDELNVLEPGGNYGWPLVSFGRTYPGPWQSQHFQTRGLPRSGRVLGAVDFDVRPRFLHGRSVTEMERGHLRRWDALRGDSEHRAPRARSDQREHGGAAARTVAGRFAAENP